MSKTFADVQFQLKVSEVFPDLKAWMDSPANEVPKDQLV